MKKTFTIALFLVFYIHTFSFSQINIDFDELNFHSDLEKTTFQKTQKNIDFGGLFSVNPLVSAAEVKEYESILTDFYAFLEKRKIRQKRPKRAIKSILWHIRKRFLKKYKEYAHFDELFTEGTFNCVTASMI